MSVGDGARGAVEMARTGGESGLSIGGSGTGAGSSDPESTVELVSVRSRSREKTVDGPGELGSLAESAVEGRSRAASRAVRVGAVWCDVADPVSGDVSSSLSSSGESTIPAVARRFLARRCRTLPVPPTANSVADRTLTILTASPPSCVISR